jgi:hypothetical protein
VDGTGTGSCPVADFAVNSVETLGSVPTEFDTK